MALPATSAFALLSRGECYALVGVQGVGHVDLARHALPAPVALPYAVEGPDVVLRTSGCPQLAGVLDHAVVSLEVDATDLATQTGWRVVLTGPAVAADGLVRIHPTDVTGYRLPVPA